MVIIFNIQNKNTNQLLRVRFTSTSEAVGLYSVLSLSFQLLLAEINGILSQCMN